MEAQCDSIFYVIVSRKSNFPSATGQDIDFSFYAADNPSLVTCFTDTETQNSIVIECQKVERKEDFVLCFECILIVRVFVCVVPPESPSCLQYIPLPEGRRTGPSLV